MSVRETCDKKKIGREDDFQLKIGQIFRFLEHLRMKLHLLKNKWKLDAVHVIYKILSCSTKQTPGKSEKTQYLIYWHLSVVANFISDLLLQIIIKKIN